MAQISRSISCPGAPFFLTKLRLATAVHTDCYSATLDTYPYLLRVRGVASNKLHAVFYIHAHTTVLENCMPDFHVSRLILAWVANRQE